MKKLDIMRVLSIFFMVILFSSACNWKQVKSKPESMNTDTNVANKSIYEAGFKLKTLEGEKEIDFSQYKGKKVLLVNVASKCGFTPQYKDLQALHEKHGDKVVILGFPSNDFGRQEPGTHEEIASFCKKNYGVSFQMFEKMSVKKGSNQAPLYQWLSDKAKNGWNEDAPNWNFCKYLINEKGELEKFYTSRVNPMGEEILKAIGV